MGMTPFLDDRTAEALTTRVSRRGSLGFSAATLAGCGGAGSQAPAATKPPDAPGSSAPASILLLSAIQLGAIGAQVRECWSHVSGTLGADTFVVRMRVTTDEAGTARIADIAAEDAGRMSDKRFRAFVERARRAVLDPYCANLKN